jgi:formylmethanofuran dehydrogenase subunit B
MNQIPDAPWIRDAEQNGWETGEEIECPVCGKACDTIYFDAFGSEIGCENCITTQDSWDWMNEKREAEREDFEEHRRRDDD